MCVVSNIETEVGVKVIPLTCEGRTLKRGNKAGIRMNVMKSSLSTYAARAPFDIPASSLPSM